MARFELTPTAELDLLNIAYFGMKRFGVACILALTADQLYDAAPGSQPRRVNLRSRPQRGPTEFVVMLERIFNDWPSTLR